MHHRQGLLDPAPRRYMLLLKALSGLLFLAVRDILPNHGCGLGELHKGAQKYIARPRVTERDYVAQ